MNVKQKINYFGYDEFKRNIPIKLEDIELPLSLEDQHELNHNWSFLRMNHDFIELIDQYYELIVILPLPSIESMAFLQIFSITHSNNGTQSIA